MSSTIKKKIDVANQMIDEWLENVIIPKGLESLNSAGFTIEIILNSRPSDVAQILGIDDYVAQIIYRDKILLSYEWVNWRNFKWLYNYLGNDNLW